MRVLLSDCGGERREIWVWRERGKMGLVGFWRVCSELRMKNRERELNMMMLLPLPWLAELRKRV